MQQRAEPAGAAKRPRKTAGGRPGRPTREQIEARNAELLDKALDMFLERGFEQTTLNKLTAAVGMAKRTVYARYGDKATLFKAALQRAIEDWVTPIERLRALETDDLDASLHAIAKVLVANIMSPAGLRLMRITNSVSHRMPEVGVYTFHRGTDRTVAYLADLFRRKLRPDGSELPDADQAAMAFLNLVVGEPARLTAWGMVLDEARIDRHTRYCVGLFLDGLRRQ
jgi:AcrR family transcriptional regulator